MILRGKKTILRPLLMSDAPRFVGWLRDSAVNKFTTRRRITLQEEKKWIKGLPRNHSQIAFAIDTKGCIHIGSVDLHNKSDENKHAQAGILIGDKNYWGKGYGTDAMETILKFGFGKLKLHRIEATVYGYNARSLAMCKKLGFNMEGVRREHIFYKGKFYDMAHFGFLRREWLGKPKRK